jgi:hypothetical protein
MSKVRMTGDLPRVDRALLQRFALLHDDDGIVTVLAARGVTGATEIRTALRRGGATLSALADEAAALAGPHLTGAAHGLVAALSSGDLYRFQLPQPVATLVTVGSQADVVPIARAFDGERPVGIVDARLDRVRIAEAADGEAHELEGIALSATGDWTEYRGPARANPLRAGESSSQRERYDRRVRVQRSRAIEDAQRRVAHLARERHWCALVVGGDPHATGGFVSDPELPPRIHVETHLPEWESAGRLVHDLADELAHARRRPVAVLTATAHVHPAAFAVGPEAVRAAIDDGRASVVVVDEPVLDRVGEVARHALAHELDVLFADGGLAELEGVFCPLHGA